MDEPDACVIGGGPIGCYIAGHLAKNNENISLFEQKQHIGYPVQCAGLVTPRVFELLNIPSKGIIQTRLKGAHIHSPAGINLSIGGDRTHAYSIDRAAFDQCLMHEAEKNGAQIHLNQPIVSIQKQNNTIELTTSKKKTIQTPLVIGADGPYSKTRDVCNFPQPKEFLRGIGAIISGTSLDPDFVEIFIGNHIAPGFFAWIIPTTTDGTEAKIGLCISQQATHHPHHYLNRFMDHTLTKPFIKNADIKRKIAGIIPLGPLKKTVDDHLMLVGDAAAQVKPTSGGGIYPGLYSAHHCATIANNAIKHQCYSSEFLQPYHDLWTKGIGRELRIGMQFRKIFTRFTDHQFNMYIKKFKEKNLDETITKHGDMDYPSKLAKPILKKMPSLITLLPKIISQ